MIQESELKKAQDSISNTLILLVFRQSSRLRRSYFLPEPRRVPTINHRSEGQLERMKPYVHSVVASDARNIHSPDNGIIGSS
jgi:hypothetical protein